MKNSEILLLSIVMLCIALIFSGCKKDDETFPSLEDFLVELVPEDSAAFVPIDAKIYALVKKMSHLHSNDKGSAKISMTMSLAANNSNIQGSTQFVEGQTLDTLFFYPQTKLPPQSVVDVHFCALWVNIDNPAILYGLEHTQRIKFKTVPLSMPENCIENIYPENSAADISTTVHPKVCFIYAIDKEFGIVGDFYKYTLLNFDASQNNIALNGSLEWNLLKDVLIFKPAQNLPPNTDIKLKISTQLMIKNNGNWQDAEMPYQQTIMFRTKADESSMVLTDNDIKSAYPVNRQYNFHKSEHPKGYLQLKGAYSWQTNPQTEYVAKFSTNNQLVSTQSITFKHNDQWFEYSLPANLENNTIYKIDFERKLNNETILFYTYYFKTSKYSTFSEKIDALSVSKNMLGTIYFNGVYCLNAMLKGSELFDIFETKAEPFAIGDYTIYKNTGIVYLEADTANGWYRRLVIKTIYSLLKSNTLALNYRNYNFFDVQPVDAIHLKPESTRLIQLTTDEISSNTVIGYPEPFSGVKIHYNQNLVMYSDYSELQSKILNMSNNEATAQMKIITMNPFPSPLEMDYQLKVKLKYTIPCINQVSTVKEVVIFE